MNRQRFRLISSLLFHFIAWFSWLKSPVQYGIEVARMNILVLFVFWQTVDWGLDSTPEACASVLVSRRIQMCSQSMCNYTLFSLWARALPLPPHFARAIGPDVSALWLWKWWDSIQEVWDLLDGWFEADLLRRGLG